jgi:RNA polymerase sigma factor (TIGR02999 family)
MDGDIDLDPEITRLIVAVREGDRQAIDRLFSIVYEDLRKIAHHQVRGTATPTLDTTALVHEVYLKIVHRSRISPTDRLHLIATASRAMRQIGVDYARASQAAKRGGGRAASLDEAREVIDSPELHIASRAAEIIALDAALDQLNRLDERLGSVVEMRFFGGFSIEEISEAMAVSPRTIKRRWRTARAFLYNELCGPGGSVGWTE